MSSKKKSGNKQQKQHQKVPKKQSSGGFPMKTLFFLTFVVLGGVIYSDIQKHGSWKDSNTAHLLKRYHVCDYSHKVLNKTSEGIKWVNSEIDKQFPGYEKKVHEIVEPYSELFVDLGVVLCNLAENFKDTIVAGLVILAQKIEELAPGLLDRTGDAIKSTLTVIEDCSKKSVKYLGEEVFVGNLAPENIAEVLMQFLSTVQQKVNEYYVWAFEKVRTVIK